MGFFSRLLHRKSIFFVLFLLSFFYGACKKDKPRFVLLDSKRTGITFNNVITESDSLNILQDEFIYNGGGVGIADFNGDGLQDIYFTANQTPNCLYINRGDLRFEDMTERSGVQKRPGEWSAGVNVLDINRDGRTDIYVCNTFVDDPEKRRNLLFVNEGNDADGAPRFREMAAAYGIADTTHSSHAQFFDYDDDGDLDLFIGSNFMDTRLPNRYIEKVTDGSSPNTDRLYRNDWNAEKGHPVFVDVTREAGIRYAGYSHSTIVADFNRDGRLDICVANDYVSNDLLYINNGDGTFSNRIAEAFKHQAGSAMGSDFADINNDGLGDLFTTEMLPYYNKRKKLFLGGNNYATYKNNDAFGYEHQYLRNVMQLNRGVNPNTGLPMFSDISFFAGTQETEWSWTPLLADFDNDGHRDLYVSNGFPRDVTDQDFAAFHASAANLMSEMDLQDLIPQVKSPDFMFRNRGDLHFEDVSNQWGLAVPAFSNGAAYADLDNDGDLDLVVNNIDDPAFVFQNTQNDQKEKPNYLRVKLVGRPENPDAIGAEATICFNGQRQFANILSGRGYLSASELFIHTGLGQAAQADSVVISWGRGEQSVVKALTANQTHTLRYADLPKTKINTGATAQPYFSALNPASLGLDYTAPDHDFVDFNYQRTLPHKFSQYGPAAAVGDVNGDGLEDIFIGAGSRDDAMWFFQQPDGRFTRRPALYKTDADRKEEDLGALLFDADADADLDLYIVRGGAQFSDGWEVYQDVLCVNDGKGNFQVAPEALPKETACGQTVEAADFDLDGDLDLFVGGRVLPMKYPRSDRSFLLRNDSKEPGKPLFTDVTEQLCADLALPGLISDALWTDFNNDNYPDLILAGEWAPLAFFQNKGGAGFAKINPGADAADRSGWWTSLSAADFDNDGDMDYVAGNFGENTYFKCTSAEPLRVYAKDFDNNGAYDPFITCYWRDSLGKRHEYVYHTRDDMVRQLISIRKKFNSYGALGDATAQDIFSKKDLEGAQILSANCMATCYVENLGGGQFRMTPLPAAAQWAPVYGMIGCDFDEDGLNDLLMTGNDYGMELLQGRADAFYGLALRKRSDATQWEALEAAQSGVFIPRDARALTRFVNPAGKDVYVATQNNDVLQVFRPSADPSGNLIRLDEKEARAEITLANGQKQRREFYRGGGYLSQASRSFRLPKGAKEVVLYDNKGAVSRTETLNH